MEQFLNTISLEALIALSGIFVALLLPISLFLLESIGGENSRTLSWDSRVILSKVLNVEELFYYILFISVPLIFWDIQKMVALILLIVGYMGLIDALYNSYQWIISKSKDSFSWHEPKYVMTYRNIKRLEYLNSLNKESEILEVWGTIFQTNGWIGVDKQKLMEAYVEALSKIARIAKTKTDIQEVVRFQYEDELASYLINSLNGQYENSIFYLDTVSSFQPLQNYIFSRYIETFDNMYQNKNSKYLLEYFIKYRNQNIFYGYDKISDSAYDFNQHLIKLITEFNKLDKNDPRENGYSRVKETLGYFGFTYLDNIDYKALHIFKDQYLPETWKISSKTLNNKNLASNNLMTEWLELIIDYIFKHRKSENSFPSGRNKYPVSDENNSRLVNIINYLFPCTNATSLTEMLVLYLFLRMRINSPKRKEWISYIENSEYSFLENKLPSNENTKANFDSEAIEIVKFFDKNFPVHQNVISESIEIISSIDFIDNLQRRKNHILAILRLIN